MTFLFLLFFKSRFKLSKANLQIVYFLYKNLNTFYNKSYRHDINKLIIQLKTYINTLGWKMLHLAVMKHYSLLFDSEL